MDIPIRQRLALEMLPEQYQAIRSLWIAHSKAEDGRDLQGLIDTLTEDCVYELVPSGHRWEGHEGARRFYMEFLSAFPDVHFDLTDIVIGPQGVIEVATLTGTFQGPWLGTPPTGEPISETIVITFPWDPQAQRFSGERVVVASRSLLGAAPTASESAG
jgi:predicted ester cyclase